MQKNHIRNLTLTSVFIAIALVLSSMSRMIYFSGGAGLRIGFSSYISVLPSFLFGPLWGGLTMGIMDVLAFLIKPEGGFLLPLTLTAIAGGILRGLIWRLFKNKHICPVPCMIVFALLTIVGIFNFAALNMNNSYGDFLRSFDKKVAFFTYLPVIFGSIALAFMALNRQLKKTKFYSPDYPAVLITLMAANITVTTINTALLLIFVPGLSGMAFGVFYLPRLAEEIANTAIQSVVVSYLLKISDRLMK